MPFIALLLLQESAEGKSRAKEEAEDSGFGTEGEDETDYLSGEGKASLSIAVPPKSVDAAPPQKKKKDRIFIQRAG